MKAKLIVEGKEFDIEILDPKLQELITPKKKTGYECVAYNEKYYTEGLGYVQSYADWGKDIDAAHYKCANYYSDKTVAENNTRADTLMRQLRRFSVEHRTKVLDWNDDTQDKYCIYYVYEDRKFVVDVYKYTRNFGNVHFDSHEAAELAIETFRDELIWYFTKYRDSL